MPLENYAELSKYADSVNLKTLPSTTFEDRSVLPLHPGIYFITTEDNVLYRRKRIQFVSNAGKTNFLGTECWYSHTVNAVDTGRFVG
jgi:hypothetical protein